MTSPTSAICRKELLVALRSRSLWFAAAALSCASGVLFVLLPAGGATAAQTLCARLMRIVPFCAAFATMGRFAGGRGDRRLESVLSAPVTHAEVVTGQFAAGLVLTLFFLAVCAAPPMSASWTGAFAAPHTSSPMLAGLAALALAAVALAAFGTLLSLLCGGEASAAALTMLVGSAVVCAALGDFPDFPPSTLAEAFDPTRFAAGAVDSRFVILCVTSAVLFVFLAVRLLESRAYVLRCAVSSMVLCAGAFLMAGCEGSGSESDDWSERPAQTQAQAQPQQKQQSGNSASSSQTSTSASSSQQSQPAAERQSAPEASSAPAAETAGVAPDQVPFGALHWEFGGRPRGSGARATGVSISGLSVHRDGLSFKYQSDLSAWGLSHGEAGAVACFFVQNASGKWVGGKFDWISSSRSSRDFVNIYGGYGGWSLANVPNPCPAAFVIISSDGKKRSNVLAGSWSR